MQLTKIFLFVLLLIIGCSQEKSKILEKIGYVQQSTSHPDNNPFSPEKYKLGEKLFFDPILSQHGDKSCATCHRPEFAFADTVKISSGAELALNPRNTPSILNIGIHQAFMMDGGLASLEQQALVPFGDDGEFESSISEAAEKLNENSEYISLFNLVFDTVPNPYSITMALACYQRELVSSDSKWDRFLQGDSSELTSAELKGWAIFNSEKANCNECHKGSLLSNLAFENVGLYKEYNDPGRMRITDKKSDAGKFKVPSLRNIALTGPYMHDGSIETLEGVIDFYMRGGEQHPNKNVLIKNFELSDSEKQDLLSFLNVLIDDEFLIE